MGLRFTTYGALKLASIVAAVAAMAALVCLIFEKFVISAILALVAVLGCQAAVLIIKDEENKKL